jgi:formamidopyrimidine-DNA glycosylase
MAIKPLLLSQRPVAGLGNIYIDEALWRARIHPELAACRVPRARVTALRKAAIDILRAAIAAKGTTISDYRSLHGNVGAYVHSLAVYGRAGGPCRRCGSTLKKIVLGARGTHFCPGCQRPPRPRKR